MARRKIQELTTGVHDFESLIMVGTKKYADKHHGAGKQPDFLVGVNCDPARLGIADMLVEKA